MGGVKLPPAEDFVFDKNCMVKAWLGATAAQSLKGKDFRVSRQRIIKQKTTKDSTDQNLQ